MVTEGEIQDPLADGWWLNSRMDPMGSQKLSRGAPTRCCLLHPNSTALKNPRHFLTQLMQTFNCSCVDRPMQANLIVCPDCPEILWRTHVKRFSSTVQLNLRETGSWCHKHHQVIVKRTNFKLSLMVGAVDSQYEDGDKYDMHNS